MHPVRFTHCVSVSTTCDGIRPCMVQDIQLVNGTNYVTLKASDPDLLQVHCEQGQVQWWRIVIAAQVAGSEDHRDVRMVCDTWVALHLVV